MRVPSFFCAGLAREDFYQRLFPRHQLLQRRLHIGQIFKTVHALGASSQFTRGLGTAQHEHAHHGGFAPGKIEGFLHAMLVFWNAAIGAAGSSGQALLVKGVQGLPYQFVVQVHHRIAIGFLVAGVHQRVERKRIVIGSGDVFLDQRAEDTSFIVS